MVTSYDILTIFCFFALVTAYFVWTDQTPRTLLNFAGSGVVLAVANQVGNAGFDFLALILIFSSVGYAILAVKK